MIGSERALTRLINELQTGGVKHLRPLSHLSSVCYQDPVQLRFLSDLSLLVYVWFWISSPPVQKEALTVCEVIKKHQKKKFCTEAV